LRYLDWDVFEELLVVIVFILPVLIEKGLCRWLSDAALKALVDPDVI